MSEGERAVERTPGEHGPGEHGHRVGDPNEPTGTLVGNMRSLHDDRDPGRSGEVPPGQMRPGETRPGEVPPAARLHEERVGNMRDLDDPAGRDDDPLTGDRTTTHTGSFDDTADTTDDLADDDTTGEKPSLLDRTKDRGDDALGRRDTDDDGRRG